MSSRLSTFRAWVALAAALGLPVLSLSAQSIQPKLEYEDVKGEGRALMRELIGRMPVENSEVFGALKIRAADGKRREVPVKYNIVVGLDSWKGIYQSQPSEGQAGQKFVVAHRPGLTNQYLLSAGPEGGSSEPAPVGVGELFAPFAGSDFWLVDLGLDFFHWPGQRVVKKEMRKGRNCKVVESFNPDLKGAGYSRVLSWIDNETGGLLRAEAFDSSGKLLKEFSVRRFKKIEGRWQLKEMEIRNDQTDSRTLLEFDLEVAEQ